MREDWATLQKSREVLTAAQNQELDKRLKKNVNSAKYKLNEAANAAGVTAEQFLASHPDVLSNADKNSLEFAKINSSETVSESQESEHDLVVALEKAKSDEEQAWQEKDRVQRGPLHDLHAATYHKYLAGIPDSAPEYPEEKKLMKMVHEAHEKALEFRRQGAEIEQKLIKLRAIKSASGS